MTLPLTLTLTLTKSSRIARRLLDGGLAARSMIGVELKTCCSK